MVRNVSNRQSVVLGGHSTRTKRSESAQKKEADLRRVSAEIVMLAYGDLHERIGNLTKKFIDGLDKSWERYPKPEIKVVGKPIKLGNERQRVELEVTAHKDMMRCVLVHIEQNWNKNHMSL